MPAGFSFARFDSAPIAANLDAVTGTGTTQVGAAPITGSISTVTGAASNTAAILPANWPIGSPIVVYGTGTAPTIFPPVGGRINNGTQNAAFTVTAGKAAMFFALPAANGLNTGQSLDYFAVLSA